MDGWIGFCVESWKALEGVAVKARSIVNVHHATDLNVK